MGELWLVRHGETQWSRSGRHTGRTDIMLTARGEQQAAALRLRLARPWAAVLTSPLQRATRTAALAGLDASVEADLREWDYGPAEGLTTAELSTGSPWNVWDDPPLGETVQDVGRRAAAVLARLPLDRGDVCLVAHGHLLRILTASWLGLPPRDGRLLVLAPAHLSVLGHEHEQRVVLSWNA